LETSLTDRPDVDEGDIDRDATSSRRSYDTTNRHNVLAPADQLFGDEMNVKSPIEAREEALEYVLKALKMAGSDGHAFRHLVDDVWRLENPQSLPMSRNRRFIESTNQLLVVLGHSSLPLQSSDVIPGHQDSLGLVKLMTFPLHPRTRRLGSGSVPKHLTALPVTLSSVASAAGSHGLGDTRVSRTVSTYDSSDRTGWRLPGLHFCHPAIHEQFRAVM
jgi:hypothetical protein